jgi:hypothetical protein
MRELIDGLTGERAIMSCANGEETQYRRLGTGEAFASGSLEDDASFG